VFHYTRNEPFLVLGFDPIVARRGEMPYSFGDYAAVWCEHGDLDFDPSIGTIGSAEPELLDVFPWEEYNIAEGPTRDQVAKLASTIFTKGRSYNVYLGNSDNRASKDRQ